MCPQQSLVKVVTLTQCTTKNKFATHFSALRCPVPTDNAKILFTLYPCNTYQLLCTRTERSLAEHANAVLLSSLETRKRRKQLALNGLHTPDGVTCL